MVDTLLTGSADGSAGSLRPPADPHTIAEVAELSGLSKDTLRWYEREGLLPTVPRGVDGRRRYDHASLRILGLLVRLRRTGMPVAQMRVFVDLLAEGAASHGRRLSLLRAHRERVEERIQQLQEDLTALQDKVSHYERLISAGLDCTGNPIEDPETLSEHRRLT